MVLIGLSKEIPEHNEMYELHRLLGALLSQELTINEKLNIIGKEYKIPMEENFRKDVSVMCNLSQGIEDKGIAIGFEQGIEQGLEQGLSKGRQEGTLFTLIGLVKDGLLSIDAAASRINMTEQEFKEKMENAKA